ncbi:hypothetical protein KCU91_g11954, partial [Aureobasidium melanogenum]
MTPLETPFDEKDVSTWNHQNVKNHVESSKTKRKAFYVNFFGWSEEEYQEARKRTSDEVLNYFDPSKKFPTTGREAKSRHTVQTNLIRDWPELFVNRHGPNPPAWFYAELINRSPTNMEIYNMKNVIQQFISFYRSLCLTTRQNQSKRRRNADEDDDDDDDDDDNGNSRVRTKQPRSSWHCKTNPFPNGTPVSVPPDLPAANQSLQTDSSRRLYGNHTNSKDDGAAITRVTARHTDYTNTNSLRNLVLYITRVTIINQTLVLERDRFALVSSLLERGQLIEQRIKELVFGNPLDNELTLLWFFDDTSDDKPRIIRNRLSAEATIAMLTARAERAQATGIQVFDAPDSDTAALVPIHEVTRRDDFVQRASFELELDDDESNEDEGTKKESKVDSAYEARDEELRLDHDFVKKEVDTRPNITWDGQQQADVESESESEEE